MGVDMMQVTSLYQLQPREERPVTAIALFGAGGKMGYRLAKNLKSLALRGSACRSGGGG